MRKIRSSAERYRAFLLFASARAWTILNAKVNRQTHGHKRGTYKLDQLAPNDILYQIYCLREWLLYLTENEHLQQTDKNCWETLLDSSRLNAHHLGDLLLVLVLLLLLSHIRWIGRRLLSWCHSLRFYRRVRQ